MAEDKSVKKNVRVHLKGVRASFLHIFKKHAYEDNEPKYSGAFIIDPKSRGGKDAIADLEDAIDAVIDATLGGKNPKNVYCLTNGDDDDRPEYEGMMIARASNKSRPKALDRDKSPLIEEDGRPYSGCYVNAIIDVYAMPKHKSVQATLMGVQFVKDGEPLSGGHLDDDEFDEVEDDEDSGSSRSKRGSGSRGRNRDDDDGDERPSRRSRDRDSDDDGDRRDGRRSGRDRNRDDDEGDRPRKRSRDEDDDGDEKPRRSSGKRSRDEDEDDRPRKRSRDFDD